MLMELEKKKSEVLVLKDGKFVCFDEIDILFKKIIVYKMLYFLWF
jgi:hypothetical protein